MTIQKLTLSINITYDADPQHYETEDPIQMALIDQANYRENPDNISDLLEQHRASISVRPEGNQTEGLVPDDFRGLSLSKNIADAIADLYLRKTNDTEGSEVIRTCGSCEQNQGLNNKYTIIRNDGSDKHKNCDYFVLDITHDKFSKPALIAYAEACEKEFPLLSIDLRAKYEK